jgi:hypothetical protein
MPVSKPAAVEDSRDRHPIKAVDDRGRVWVHHDPLRLYRFIRARPSLLKAIDANPR